MALSARYAKASDTFDSSIDGNWTNGPGNADPMTWVTGGYVRNSTTTSDCAMCYTGTSFGANQYSKTVVNALSGGSYGSAWAIVRMNSLNGACYFGQMRESASDPRFTIFEADTSFGTSQLAASGAVAGFTAGDFLVMEVSGSNLELYATVNGGAEISRLTATDSTLTSGSPGVGINTDSTYQITSWEGGDDVAPGPTINTHPANTSANLGATANFTVSATASAGSLTYQWQSRMPGGTPADIGGATSSSYTTPALGNDENNKLFRCNVTDSNGTVATNEARLTVNPVTAYSWTVA